MRAPASNCKYDAAKAKALLAEAGGWKGGKLELWANAGAGHDKWMQAVGDQLKTNLGIDYELKVDLQFAAVPRRPPTTKKFTGPFRLGWGPDYPSLETYLTPLYGTQGSSNNTGYSNAEFDNCWSRATPAKSIAEGITFYQQAEDIVVRGPAGHPDVVRQDRACVSENVKDIRLQPGHGAVYYGDHAQTSALH